MLNSTKNADMFSAASDPFVAQACAEILKQYGDHVSVGEKSKSLRKFGRRTLSADATATIWDTPSEVNETYLGAGENTISTVSSSSTSDVGQDLIVEGMVSSPAGLLTFVTQTVVMDGQAKAPLSTPLNRATRM